MDTNPRVLLTLEIEEEALSNIEFLNQYFTQSLDGEGFRLIRIEYANFPPEAFNPDTTPMVDTRMH